MASGVYVFTSGAYALNSGMVVSATCGQSVSGSALLVDPGYFPSDLDRISGFLANRGYEASRIILTHSDWDHIVGPSRFPRARVVTSSAFPGRVLAEGVRIERSLRDFDTKLYVRREPAFYIPRPDSLAGSPADLVWEGPGARLLPAGGHTPDGLMLLLRESRILFTGDHLSDLEIPFVGDSVAAYRQTLGLVRTLLRNGSIELLVPGHGEVCGRDAIEERLDEDEDYLARLESWVREVRRTVEALDGVVERSDEIVFRKGWDNPDIRSEHRSNVARLFCG